MELTQAEDMKAFDDLRHDRFKESMTKSEFMFAMSDAYLLGYKQACSVAMQNFSVSK